MDIYTVAARVSRALRTIGHLMGEQNPEVSAFLIDSANELDEASGQEETAPRARPAALAKPEHKK